MKDRREEVQKKLTVYVLVGVFYKITAVFELKITDPNTKHFSKIESGMIEFLKIYKHL